MTVGSDSRKKVSFWVGPSFSENEAGSQSASLSTMLTVRPSSTFALSIRPQLSGSRTVAQYVTTVRDVFAVDTYGTRYVFAAIDQRRGELTTRFDLTLTPRLSAQLYAEPFFGIGRYRDFEELVRPRTFDFARYGADRGTIAMDDTARRYLIDPDGDGPAPPFSVDNSNFKFKSLTMKSVVRWEWRPGSTLYLVWTQRRTDDSNSDIGGFFDVRSLLRASADNVFAVKMSYWFSR